MIFTSKYLIEDLFSFFEASGKSAILQNLTKFKNLYTFKSLSELSGI